MKTVVIGRTDVTLTLNQCKTYIRGKSEAVIDVVNDAQRRELAVLEREKLITIIDNEEQVPDLLAEHARMINPEQKRAMEAEAKTQRMGSRVIISTGDGVVRGKMTRSAASDICESEATKASVEALKKLEEEEIFDDLVIDENILNPSDQMGRKATVGTGADTQGVNLVNSLVGKSNRDPFIDKKDNTEKEKLLSEQNSKPKTISKSEEPTVDIDSTSISDADLFTSTDAEDVSNDDDDLFIEI